MRRGKRIEKVLVGEKRKLEEMRGVGEGRGKGSGGRGRVDGEEERVISYQVKVNFKTE